MEDAKTGAMLAGQLASCTVGHTCLAFPFLGHIFDIYRGRATLPA